MNQPNQWEWRSLGDICDFYHGKNINNQNIALRPGNYPVYSSQTYRNGEIGRWDTYDFDGEYLTWTTHGIYAGSVFYRLGKFSITSNCGIFKCKDLNKYCLKYIYYYLSKVLKNYVNLGSTIPILNVGVVKKD